VDVVADALPGSNVATVVRTASAATMRIETFRRRERGSRAPAVAGGE
jgi:hypothetical protein